MGPSGLTLGCLSVAACLMGAVCVDSFAKSAFASSDGPVLLNMPIYNRTSSDDLIRQAEFMGGQEIIQHFNTNPSLTDIEVVVLGNRNGDIVPVLTTVVSRIQWQENSDVSAWTEYYGSHALLQRHDRREPQPVQVATPRRRSTTVASQTISVQFERQFDSGQLAGRTVQSYMDLVD